MKNRKILYIIPIIIVIADQFVKNLIVTENFLLTSNLINITYIKNTGGAFSILENNMLWISTFSVLVICIIYKLLKERMNQLSLKDIIPLCMILGGAIGNLIDRIFRKYVVDYIEITLFSFPIFNIADIFILVGTIMIGIIMIMNIIREKC